MFSLDHEKLRARAIARVGSTIKGKYTLEALLGAGGMAAVYRARHRTGLRVALKVVHPMLAVQTDARAWLLREGTIANAIEHPGVLRVLDDDEDDHGSPFLVMELADGESLADHAARLGGRLPAGKVLEIADATLDVLAAIHERGVVHCDVKPDNLLLGGDGRVVLLDFGIARTPGLASPGLPAEIATAPMGTPDFMPPEQATGHWDWVDARSDVYALGATMFTLLSGRFVRDGVSVRAQLDAARRDPAPSLSHVAPGLRAALTEVVDRALSFDPEARYASAREMQLAVRDARGSYVGGAERALAARRQPQSGLHLAVNPHAPTAHARVLRAS